MPVIAMGIAATIPASRGSEACEPVTGVIGCAAVIRWTLTRRDGQVLGPQSLPLSRCGARGFAAEQLFHPIGARRPRRRVFYGEPDEAARRQRLLLLAHRNVAVDALPDHLGRRAGRRVSNHERDVNRVTGGELVGFRRDLAVRRDRPADLEPVFVRVTVVRTRRRASVARGRRARGFAAAGAEHQGERKGYRDSDRLHSMDLAFSPSILTGFRPIAILECCPGQWWQ